MNPVKPIVNAFRFLTSPGTRVPDDAHPFGAPIDRGGGMPLVPTAFGPIGQRMMLEKAGTAKYIAKRNAWNNQRESLMSEWLDNLSMYAARGYNQIYQLPPSQFSDADIEESAQAVFRHVRHYPRLLRGVASKLTERDRAWRARPRTGETEDMMSAKAATQALQHMQRFLREMRKNQRLAILMLATGNAFKMAWYNPKMPTEVMIEPDDLEAAYGGNPGAAAFEFAEGEIDTAVISPFCVFADGRYPTWDDCDEFTIQMIRSEAWLEENAPELYEQRGRLEAEDSSDEKRQMISEIVGDLDMSDENAGEHYVIDQHFKRVRGRGVRATYQTVIYSDAVIIDQGIVNYRCAQHYPCFPVEGSLWADSLGSALKDIQNEYDGRVNDLGDHIALHTHPDLWIPAGATVNEDNLTNAPGNVYDFTPGPNGEVPFFMTPPTINHDVWECFEFYEKVMSDIAALREVSQAGTPAGVKSGIAIRALQRADDQYWKETFDAIEEAEADHGLAVFLLMQEHWSRARAVAVVGSDQTHTIRSLSSRDFAGVSDVFIEVAPRTMTIEEQQEFWSGLAEKGLLHEERQPELEKLLDALNMPNVLQQPNRISAARDTIRKWIQKVKDSKGAFRPVAEIYHDHAVMLDELVIFLNTPEVDMLNEEQRSALRNLYTSLRSFIQNTQMEEAQAMAGAQPVQPQGANVMQLG